jgi:hypothetical protein
MKFNLWTEQNDNNLTFFMQYGTSDTYHCSIDIEKDSYLGEVNSLILFIIETMLLRGINKMSDKKWMQKAFSKNKGKLHRELHVPEGEKIPAKKLAKAAKSKNPTMRKEVQLAETARKINRKK